MAGRYPVLALYALVTTATGGPGAFLEHANAWATLHNTISLGSAEPVELFRRVTEVVAADDSRDRAMLDLLRVAAGVPIAPPPRTSCAPSGHTAPRCGTGARCSARSFVRTI